MLAARSEPGERERALELTRSSREHYRNLDMDAFAIEAAQLERTFERRGRATRTGTARATAGSKRGRMAGRPLNRGDKPANCYIAFERALRRNRFLSRDCVPSHARDGND